MSEDTLLNFRITRLIIGLGLGLTMTGLPAFAKNDCSNTLDKLQARGLSPEALRAFQKSITRAGVLEDVKSKDFVAIVDLSRPRREDRFFILDLRNGSLIEAEKTTHGKGNDADGEGRVRHIDRQVRGRHMAPGGLMKIGHPRQLRSERGTGLDLRGLESDNRQVNASGIMIQTCRSMENPSSLSRSMGSFCLSRDRIHNLAPILKDSYLYSARPQDTRQPLSPKERSEICSLFKENSQAHRYDSNDMSQVVAPGVENQSASGLIFEESGVQ